MIAVDVRDEDNSGLHEGAVDLLFRTKVIQKLAIRPFSRIHEHSTSFVEHKDGTGASV